MNSVLTDPADHKEWLVPHSFQWYAQLGRLTGKYAYPWHSTLIGPDAEAIFESEVAALVPGARVLDIGCGHGEFTLRWSALVREIVGLDITEDFIVTANSEEYANVSFVTANTKDGLPFEDGQFDCAYNRKGPTSSYPELTRIIRKGGRLISLHPGDRLSPELSLLFPGLFPPQLQGTPVLDKLDQRIVESGFASAEVATITARQYFHEPMDIVRLRCFGQTAAVQEQVVQDSLPEIRRIFDRHRTELGLPATVDHYIVRATI